MSEEEIIEENIRRYIKEHSTTIKAYTQAYVDKKDKEIERLNNIINELEKHIKENCWKDDYNVDTIYVKSILNKLQELKDSDK